MQMRDGLPLFAFCFNGSTDGAVCPAPADDEKVSFFIPFDRGRRYIVCDTIDLCLTHLHHELVVLGIVAYIPGNVLLLESSDAVFKAGRSRDRPGACERLLISKVGKEPF